METASFSQHSSKQKAERLHALASGPLSSSIARLSASSRTIPSDKDFHYYNNFPEFKNPIKEIKNKSEAILKTIGSSSHSLFGKSLCFPEDPDDLMDWLGDVNDEVLERSDASIDEFEVSRKRKEEEARKKGTSLETESGFQVVHGKKKKDEHQNIDRGQGRQDSSPLVKMASKDPKTTGAARSRIPFHIWNMQRPQDEFGILVDNSNHPFEHVWLQKNEDGARLIHPLEKHSELDFIDRESGDSEPAKPLPLESTPFKIVESVNELKELAIKLREAKEFAVDLEHNHYRSFQGITCLMQISTRTEDFIVDTLKLRVQVGPYLREVFKEPSKRKVLHGADKDILWLQRDFGIYVCNMFDTGQASRVLQLERNSLEFLLHHYCAVAANKEYQTADWRLRPLPEEMIKYAREDTHYLLHIYDLMKAELLAESKGGDDLLLEVYKRSYDICMQLYEKELLTDISYLHIYGLQGAGFSSEQLAIVSGLCEWRDVVARAEDESTGYILPNKALLEIARQMPQTAGNLRRLVKSRHPYVEQNLSSVISIIRNSIKNAPAFEIASEELKKGREEESVPKQNVEADPSELESMPVTEDFMNIEISCAEAETIVQSDQPTEQREGISKQPSNSSSEMEHSSSFSGEIGETSDRVETFPPVKSLSVASVLKLKKPSRAFGAMLGNSACKRKLEQDKAEIKVEQIRSSVSLPFHSFAGGSELPIPIPVESTVHIPDIIGQQGIGGPAQASNLGEFILLKEKSNDEVESSEIPTQTADNSLARRENDKTGDSEPELDTGNEDDSLAELSSSFQDCFKSLNEIRNGPTKMERKHEENFDRNPQLKPFDYANARKQMRFGKNGKEEKASDGGPGARPLDFKASKKGTSKASEQDEKNDFQQGRRRQAFPASGNRSATFRN